MLGLALKNITRRLGTSAVSMLVVLIAVFSVVLSTACVLAVDDGLKLSKERLGADLMVLPAGASTGANQVLFTAAPVNMYLEADAVETIRSLEGVKAASPQFFTQTVDESCCSVVGVTRVVGIDVDSDFTVVPWLDYTVENLGASGILVGAAAPRIEGGQASILGQVFQVEGYLQPTGTSVDETIFMDIDAARSIAMASPYLASVWEGKDASNSISCVMVEAGENVNIEELAETISQAYPGVVAASTSQMVSNVSNQLGIIRTVALVMLALLIVVAALALAGRVSAIVSGRMAELGLLRTMGATRSSVIGYLSCEVGILVAVGMLGGIVAGIACSTAAVDVLRSNFQLPVSEGANLAIAAGAGLVFSLALGLVCLVVPLVRTLKNDPLDTLLKGGLR